MSKTTIKPMRESRLKKMASLGSVGVMVLGPCASWALPTLQLDILGGSYNQADQTTYSSGSSFTLRALLNGRTAQSAGTYYISAAITPRVAQTDPPPFGSFIVGGTTFSLANNNLYYGTPPVDVPDTARGNLAPHGVFPTYYAEVAFAFNPAQTVAAYNTADGITGPGSLYYHDFAVDAGGLGAGYSVHFDLYDETMYQIGRKKGGGTTTYTVDDFAPFSHDAESHARVPDAGSTILLLGCGLVGVHVAQRRFAKG